MPRSGIPLVGRRSAVAVLALSMMWGGDVAHAQTAASSRVMQSCLRTLRATKQGRRVADSIWTRHTTQLTPDARVLAALDAQPEFKLPLWDYLAVMVDDERVADGQQRMAEQRATFDAIARRYKVDPYVVAAIWGVETDYGRGMGSYNVLRSLATLSCNGRRQAYFRRELLAALRIVQSGDVDGSRFLGSWAGAFGQVQFMPGTFEWLAVDFDGDGRRRLRRSTPDALASAANYLRRSKWVDGQPWGIEVQLPPGFSAKGEGRRVKRAISTWAARKLRRIDGSPLVSSTLPATRMAGLHLPAGPLGPAFLVFQNFDAIYRYNASETYTLAVAHLADRLRGAGDFATPWPTDDLGLSRKERRELQRLLAARGHEIGAPSGVLTARTRAAVKTEQERLGHPVTGRPGQRLLRELRAGG